MRHATQKQTKYSMLQIKTIPKNVSTSTSWNFSLLYIPFIYLTTISETPYKFSEETTQRKHTYTHVTTFPRSTITTKIMAKNIISKYKDQEIETEKMW